MIWLAVIWCSLCALFVGSCALIALTAAASAHTATKASGLHGITDQPNEGETR